MSTYNDWPATSAARNGNTATQLPVVQIPNGYPGKKYLKVPALLDMFLRWMKLFSHWSISVEQTVCCRKSRRHHWHSDSSLAVGWNVSTYSYYTS